MKTLLKLTAVVAMLYAVGIAQAQNWPLQATYQLYTNQTSLSASGIATNSTKVFTSPLAYTVAGSTYSGVLYQTTAIVETNPATLTYATNTTTIVPVLAILTNAAIGKLANLYSVLVSNSGSSALLYSWSPANTASNINTNTWSYLGIGEKVSYGRDNVIPVGVFNAVTPSTGTVSIATGSVHLELLGQ